MNFNSKGISKQHFIVIDVHEYFFILFTSFIRHFSVSKFQHDVPLLQQFFLIINHINLSLRLLQFTILNYQNECSYKKNLYLKKTCRWN